VKVVTRLFFVASLATLGCGSSDDSTTAAAADTGTSASDTSVDDTATSGDDTGAPPSDTATSSDTGGDPFGAYPAGPYGNKVGDVVANLDWEGYVSPLSDALANTKPYVTTSMDKLRRDAKKGYALIHVSEFL